MSEISRPMMKKVKFIVETLGIEYPYGGSYAKMWEFIQQYYDEAVEVSERKADEFDYSSEE